MSQIFVAEYPGLAQTDNSDSVNILAIPPTVTYTVVVSAGVSRAANAIQPTTKFIEVSTDTTASFTIGTASGTVTLTDCRLAPNERVIRRVPNVMQLPGNHLQSAAPINFVFTTANA